MEIENSNQFIFAKAFPIFKTGGENVYFDQIQDEKFKLLDRLSACRMQLDLSFEVLTGRFLLESIKKKSPKILHLSPLMQKLEGNDSLIVENQQFEAASVTAEDLKGIGDLGTFMVIIELTDC